MSEPLARPSDWFGALDHEDGVFLRRFVLASGSLKQLAEEYGVSYRTVRARLDRLIAKVRAAEDLQNDDPLERRLRMLVADGRMAPALARELSNLYRGALEQKVKS